MDTALEKTRVRDQNSIVQQIQRVRLYKDQVIRKTGKFQVDEELAMTTEKVTRTLVSGKCGIFVMPAVAI
jgi:hypothetical protein